MSEEPRPQGWSSVPLRIRILLVGALALSLAAWRWNNRERPPTAPAAAPGPALPTRLEPERLTSTEAEREASPLLTTYRREIERPKPVQSAPESAPPREEPAPQAAPGGPMSRRRDEKKALPEVFRMPADGRPAPEPAAARAKKADPGSAPAEPAEFAPFGRLVRCQLVDTLDSLTARAQPIVALVTQDLDWNGDVIVPAGTEAFSYARPEPVVDAAGVGRLVDNGEWTLVLPSSGGGENGRELLLRARAVDRREGALSQTGQPSSWGIDDGADGLVGYTLSTLDNREIKLFAAAAVSGMVQGFGAFSQREQAVPGVAGALGATQPAPTLGNALTASLSAGGADYLNQVAARIRDEISRRGVYVRVPAGKTFYLFVEQTIDPLEARVGLRLPARKEAPR
jgi:hypothetical protein